MGCISAPHNILLRGGVLVTAKPDRATIGHGTSGGARVGGRDQVAVILLGNVDDMHMHGNAGLEDGNMDSVGLDVGGQTAQHVVDILMDGILTDDDGLSDRVSIANDIDDIHLVAVLDLGSFGLAGVLTPDIELLGPFHKDAEGTLDHGDEHHGMLDADGHEVGIEADAELGTLILGVLEYGSVALVLILQAGLAQSGKHELCLCGLRNQIDDLVGGLRIQTNGDSVKVLHNLCSPLKLSFLIYKEDML